MDGAARRDVDTDRQGCAPSPTLVGSAPMLAARAWLRSTAAWEVELR